MPTAENQTARTPVRRVGRSSRIPTIVTAALAALLLVAMGVSTRWLTPAQVDALTPKPFDPAEYAAQKFPEIQAFVAAKAVDVTALVPALSEDADAAGKKFGVDSGSGKFTIPVTATAKVASVDESFILLSTPELKEWKVRIPIGTTMNGTPIRDVTGTISFGDFTDQSTYQDVSAAFKEVAQKEVVAKVDTASLVGREITVQGAFATGGPDGQVLIQPVRLEVHG
jgi:predicted lipoprotein